MYARLITASTCHKPCLGAGRLCDEATKAALCDATDTAHSASVAAVLHSADAKDFRNHTGEA